MPYQVKIILLFLLVFYLASCRENEDPANNYPQEPNSSGISKECIKSQFCDTLNIEFDPVWIVEDYTSNILLLGKNSNSDIVVLKLDSDGNLIWVKEYQEITGKVMNIIQIGDAYYINSGTYTFSYDEPGITYYNVLVESGYLIDESDNYFKIYELQSSYTPSFVLPPNNTNSLTKIDTAGNVLWTKEFEGNYFSGTSLDTTADGHILLLTSVIAGFGDKLVMNNGLFQDTILRPTDNHQVKLHKIDTNGNLVWETKVDSILEFERENAISTSYLSLCCGQDEILVNTKNATITFDLEGNVLNRFHPITGKDSSRPLKVASAPNNSNYYCGNIYPHNNWETGKFIAKIDEYENIEWLIQDNYVHAAHLFSFKESGFIIRYYNADEINKYNDNGNLIWNKSYENYPLIMNTSCSGGVIFCTADQNSDYIIVSKVNENGSYN